ncbi:MAG: TlpA family protein disulfide reductase [Candidatus Kapaibacterium sp.]
MYSSELVLPNLTFIIMRLLRIFLCIAPLIASCAPTPDATNGDNTTDIPPKYQNNISTIFGTGTTNVKDNTGYYVASNITWKDSLGALHTLDELRGNIIVLNFWAMWCDYCRQEMPDLQSIADTYKDQNVIVLGVSVDKGSSAFDEVKLYIDSTVRVKFQIIVDPPAKSYFNYGAHDGLPWTFIIDADGHVRITFSGEPKKQQFVDAINQLL